MNNKTLLIILAVVLLLIGIFKPNLGVVVPNNGPVPVVNVVEPNDPELKASCLEVAKILQKGGSSDALRLSSLYSDIGDLIALDGENEVVKNTEEIRQTNKLSGLLLRLDIKGKYEGLAEAAEKVIVTGIGSDDVSLDKELRNKAVTSFKALAWACKEGSK
jgi:hypothetical protein